MERNTGLKIIRCSLVFSFIVSISICFQTLAAAASMDKPKYGGTLTYSDYSDGTFIGYPAKMNRVSAFRQAAPAIEKLLRYDKNGRLVPWLATAYKESDKDKSITLTLRKGGQVPRWNGFQRRSSKMEP